MKLKEKIELIKGSSSKEILNGGGHNGTPLLKYVYEIHQEVFGIPCKSCSELIPKYITKIQNINLNTEIMSSEERKYRMKSGSVIRVNGTNRYYSDMNITDKIAEEVLKVNPNRSVLFAKMPEGAMERLQKEAAEEAETPQATPETPVETPENTEEETTEATPKESEGTPAEEEAAEEAEKADEDLTFTELREKYPDIKARSKEGFLKDLEEARKQAE